MPRGVRSGIEPGVYKDTRSIQPDDLALGKQRADLQSERLLVQRRGDADIGQVKFSHVRASGSKSLLRQR